MPPSLELERRYYSNLPLSTIKWACETFSVASNFLLDGSIPTIPATNSPSRFYSSQLLGLYTPTRSVDTRSLSQNLLSTPAHGNLVARESAPNTCSPNRSPVVSPTGSLGIPVTPSRRMHQNPSTPTVNIVSNRSILVGNSILNCCTTTDQEVMED